MLNNPTVVFDPYAAADLHNILQTMVHNYNVAVTGQAAWYPVAFFLKDENGEVLLSVSQIDTIPAFYAAIHYSN